MKNIFTQLLFVFALLQLFTAQLFAAGTVRWNGSTSTAWGTSANWTVVSGSPTTPPSFDDAVEIGMVTATFQPSVSDSRSITSLTFGRRQATTLTIGSGDVTVSGNWTNSNGTTGATGAVVMNGASPTISATTFNNLTLNNSTGTTLTGSVVVNGAVTLTTGTLAVGTNTLTLNGSVGASSGTLTSSTSVTVSYNQSSNGQSVLAANYGNLTFSNFNKTLPSSGTIGIAGTFTTGSATGHTISGSTFNFNGSTTQTIPAFNYHHLTSSSTGDRTLASSGVIGIAGTFTTGTNNYSTSGSTMNFNGTVSQTISANCVSPLGR